MCLFALLGFVAPSGSKIITETFGNWEKADLMNSQTTSQSKPLSTPSLQAVSLELD
ncbi:hypothetical protein CAL7102_00017 [Dulcicalothrix desertica PCC 7102]|nr:hypothetical protein CAL7102_00017 [Dulcicalothrix desertica PCC 7102]